MEELDKSGLLMLGITIFKGDMELAKTLVTDLGANVDAAGVMDGIAPLWIIRFDGHIYMAWYQANKGASAQCKDGEYRHTILRFLNR